jgi:transposase-like protein
MTMDESIMRWTAKRKTALVIEIIQGKTTVAEASRSFDLSPSSLQKLYTTQQGMRHDQICLRDYLGINEAELKSDFVESARDARFY